MILLEHDAKVLAEAHGLPVPSGIYCEVCGFPG